MAQQIKNRIFGSDIPTQLKKKIESRQLLAYSSRGPNEAIGNSLYPDSRTTGGTPLPGETTGRGHYSYEELNNMNFCWNC